MAVRSFSNWVKLTYFVQFLLLKIFQFLYFGPNSWCNTKHYFFNPPPSTVHVIRGITYWQRAWHMENWIGTDSSDGVSES